VDSIRVLVDLGNTSHFRNLVSPNPIIVGDRIDTLLTTSVDSFLPIFSLSFEAHFRLYHGWFDDIGQPTDLHYLSTKHLRERYPTRTKRARIFAELGEAPASLGTCQLHHTMRVERGLPPFSLIFVDEIPKGCKHPDNCALFEFKKWIKGRCPRHKEGCSVLISDVISHRRQKLIDTMLVADLVWFATHGENVAVVSDDEDVIPGLLCASTSAVDVYWICRNGQPREQYESLIKLQGIRCLSWQI
jgi:hypothetical protein